MSPVTEPMTAERFAEIEASNLRDVQMYDAVGLSEAEVDRADLFTEVHRLRAELHQARQRIEELERDRAGRPNWSDGRDLAIRLRNENATDDEIRDAFLNLWGGAS